MQISFMSYTFYDFLVLVGSLGLFLYGMKLMSEGLQKIAGDKLRAVLSAMTSNRFVGMLTGLLITTVIQSSSATTVMVVSFVNAGLLSLVQSVSVIMGANIGTTVTAWIISLLGFKVSMSVLALPIIAFSIPFIFSSHNKRKSFGEFLLGFSILFMGLEYLKNSVPDIQSNPEILAFLTQYTNYGFGSVLIFVLIGTLLTVVVQSSSATVAITLVMCAKGWIPYELAVAMVLGENIGTTITANIAAIPANVSAKRAALSHLFFNVFGVIWVLCLFYPFTSMIKYIVTEFGPGDPTQLMAFTSSIDPQLLTAFDDPKAVLSPEQLALKEQYISYQVSTSYAISLFHTLFNVCNTCIMIWFVNLLAKIVTKCIPQSSKDEEFRLRYISTGMLSTSELSIVQASKEINLYAERSVRMFGIVKQLYDEPDNEQFEKTFKRIEKYEDICDRMEIEIANYLTRVAEGKLSDSSKIKVHAMLRVISEVESISDSCFNMARIIRRRHDNKIEFSDEIRNNIYGMFGLVQSSLDEMMRIVPKDGIAEVHHPDTTASYAIENDINAMRNNLKAKNADDLNAQKYPYQVSVSYMDIVGECEKVGDYVINVVEQYKEL